MKLENLDLRRLTVHKIFGRSKTSAVPYAEECGDICTLDVDGMETLHKRIDACLNHRNKFYQLDLEDSDKDSFFEIQKPLCGSSREDFVEISQQIADKAAETHTNANIPDGLILVIEAKIDGFDTVIVVKAEKSNAFSLAKQGMNLVKDVFLSSDKTLYKVGFCLKLDKRNSNPKSYRYYVYDDLFTPSKGDLAHYFYSKFLGLTTDKNSKLLTNKLHKALTKFSKDYIDVSDQYDVMRTIDRAFMDSNRINMHASDFKSFFSDDLQQHFESTIEVEFPNSFIKDNGILGQIDTKRIALSDDATLILKHAPAGIQIGSSSDQEAKAKLKASIDSGKSFNFAIIPTATAIKSE